MSGSRIEHGLTLLATVVGLTAGLSSVLTATAIVERPPAPESRGRIAEFDRRFETVIMPRYRELGVGGSFKGLGFQPGETTDARRINYRAFQRTSERGAIVISPGRGELEIQYAELIYDLTEQGYSVYILDHRGSGFSERLPGAGTTAHVERFLDYSADFKQFVDEVVRPETHANLYLLCHAMGCTVAAPFLTANPKLFRAVAMTAPMFELPLSRTQQVTALLERLSLLPESMQKSIAPGALPYDENVAFEGNPSTGSWMRFRKAREMLADSEQALTRALGKRVRLGLGGPSNRWLAEAQSAMADIENQEPWRTPTLMLQAGKDSQVGEAAQGRLCERIASTGAPCRLLRSEDARHDLWFERDAIRSHALEQIATFFSRHGA